jgi:hypothetical protein
VSGLNSKLRPRLPRETESSFDTKIECFNSKAIPFLKKLQETINQAVDIAGRPSPPVARDRSAPLLFKGDDFRQTYVVVATY